MARTHAHVKTSMWNDDAFRALPWRAQHLYMALWTGADLSFCGVADWRPPRLCKRAADLTLDDVIDAGLVLHERLYVVVDEATEEVLIRSFIRNDGLMDQPNVAAAMVRDYGTIASSAIRGVVVHELRRLHDEYPDLKGWVDIKTGKERAAALLGNPSVDPSGNPSGWGSGNPSGNPSPNPSDEVPERVNGTLRVTHAPLPSPNSLLPAPAPGSPSGPRSPRKRHIPDDWQPNDRHRKIAADLEIDVAAEVDKFRDYDKAKGPVWKDFDAAFNNWLRNNAHWGNSKRNPYGRQQETDAMFDAAMQRAVERDQQELTP